MTKIKMTKEGRLKLKNQRLTELIQAPKTSHNHDNSELSRLRQLPPGMRVNTKYILKKCDPF